MAPKSAICRAIADCHPRHRPESPGEQNPVANASREVELERACSQRLREAAEPDLILCSSARRTLQTKDIIRPYLPRACPVEQSSSIYEAGIEQIFAALADVPDSIGMLMVIGHNPGLERLAVSLCGETAGDDMDRLRAKFPTGALAFIELEIDDWKKIAPETGKLQRFVTPKDLV